MDRERDNDEKKIFQFCVRNNVKYNILNSYFQKEKIIDNFQVRPSDVWLFGFPQSGSTKLREIIWLVENNCNVCRARLTVIDERFPLLETELYTSQGAVWQKYSITFVKSIKKPRFIRCGLQWPFLPKDIRTGMIRPKMIYIHREPKDLVASYYHGAKKINAYNGPFEPLAEMFLKDESPYWQHLLDFKRRRNLLQLLIISFEEIENDLEAAIRRITNFLDKSISDAQIKEMASFLDISKKEKYLSYKVLMGSEMIRQFDEWSFPNLFDESEITQFDPE